MSESPAQDPAQLRKLGRLQLVLAGVLTLVIVGLVFLNRQYWMFALLVLVIPNIYMGVRAIRTSRKP